MIKPCVAQWGVGTKLPSNKLCSSQYCIIWTFMVDFIFVILHWISWWRTFIYSILGLYLGFVMAKVLKIYDDLWVGYNAILVR